MRFYEKIKKFFEGRARYWYIIVAIFILLGLADNALLNIVAPTWVCTSIMMLLIVLSTCYVAIMYRFIRDKCKTYMDKRKEMLFVRIEDLENNINELNKKNIELENKLAEAINTNVNDNTLKIINELTEMVRETSEHIENRVQNFADNIDIRLNKDVENILTIVTDGFENHKTLSNNNTETITRLVEEASNRIKEKVQNCSDTHIKSIEDLSYYVKMFRGETQKNIKEIDTRITENTDKILEIMNDYSQKGTITSEEQIKLIKELDEKFSVKEEEGRAILLSETNRIIQKVEENNEQNKKLLLEEQDIIHSSVALIGDRIKDASLVEAGLVNGVSENFEVFKNTLCSDTDILAKKLTDQVDKVIGKLDEKTKRDDEISEEHLKLINTLEEKVAFVGKANQDITINESVKVLKIMKEHNEEQKRLFAMQREYLNSSKSQIEEKIILGCKENKEITENAKERILEKVNKYGESQAILFQEQKEDIANAVIRIEEKIKEASGIESELVAGLSETVSAVREKVNANTDKLSGELTGHISQIIGKLQEKSIVDEEVNSIQAEMIKDIVERIDAIKLLTSEKADAISTKANEMQNEIVKLLIQVLDDADIKSDKLDSAYNRIFTQVVDFSKGTKKNIEKLQNAIDAQQLSLGKERHLSALSIEEQLLQTRSLKDKIDTYSIVAEKYQIDISGKLNNLQNQIVNLNALAEVLRNISAAPKQEITKTNQNRTEEIKDVQTGITVYNHYEYDKLISSEMLTGKKKNYDVEYDDQGRIVRSRNYGSNGDIATELEFYTNGQVKRRTEKVMVNGKLQTVKSEFDEQGNKLK
ncbi:hypothetical protein [Clostridium omnivorum]|uniref:Uncharacterized protein n=1 Tax=Clostridium omnivorum TaxID=1604902 RepID=A0ABQ5N7B4_9CLOT|nr:hypothetical protein [Clostridium sp. E14]GLC31140.1 hypothetical protein bsdE14_25500 [Clostridium sp. E14]